MKKKSRAKLRAIQRAKNLILYGSEVKPEFDVPEIEFEIEMEAWVDPRFKLTSFAPTCKMNCLKEIRETLDSYYDAGYAETEVFDFVTEDCVAECENRADGKCPTKEQFAEMLEIELKNC